MSKGKKKRRKVKGNILGSSVKGKNLCDLITSRVSRLPSKVQSSPAVAGSQMMIGVQSLTKEV
jgi:hypothetical protein